MFLTNCRGSLIVLASLPLALAFVCPCQADTQWNAVSPELQKKAIAILRAVMKEAKAFEEIHAAEALIWTGHPEGIKEFFLQEDRDAGSEPQLTYRVGIWRTLYRINAGNPAAQQEYLKKLLALFSDPKAQDRGTSAETLGKIKYAGAGHVIMVADLAEHGKDDLRVWARWILANSGKAEDEARLAECLRSKDPKDRLYAAYALRHLKTLRPATLKLLQDLAPTEPTDGEVTCYVLGALFTHLPADRREPIKRQLLACVANGNTDQRYQACMALANWPTEDMISVVEKLLANTSADERIGGAYVLLKIGRPRDGADPNH